MSEWLVILLLPVAAWSGWWIAMRKEAREWRADKSRSAYVEGLTFLLNDQTDRAVDVFLNMANVNRQAVDNQLTLGSLFRKRGELDRALHLHRQLADYEGLEESQRLAVTFELAQDYAAAGMYLQAQQYLEALSAANYQSREVIPLLLGIYERTRNWTAAIDLANLWMARGFGDRHLQMAHYYCELAERAMRRDDRESAYAALDQALALDRDHIRAYWLRARYLLAHGQAVQAISSFLAVAERSPSFIPEILGDLEKAYQAVGRSEEFHAWLEANEARHGNIRLTLAAARVLHGYDAEKARELLDKRLQEKKSALLLASWLEAQPHPEAQKLHGLLQRSLSPHTVYQCNECGFRQQKPVWRCPACFAWSSFEPLIELKLEEK
ncbi:MAG: lipopolysaccharide assembly protein LapB [Cardiobacteriaceae bacterium]|nr:lipopolysaccharide assembly protein LapB [Cardiobacteriaceae bacterium]